MPPKPAIVRAMRDAVAHHQAGRFAQAEHIYKRVLQQDPRDPDALHLLGLLHHQLRRNESAVDLISRAVAIQPKGVFYVNLSQAQRALGLKREALESCRRAAQLEPALAEAWNNLGTLLQQIGQAEESAAALRKAVEINPRYVAAWSNLGNSLSALGRADEAEAALRKAVEIEPNFATGYNNLATLLNRIGRFDEAIELCRSAIALAPNLAAAYANLGVALSSQGRLDEGNEAFLRAAQVEPNNYRAMENFLGGMSYTTRYSPQEVFEAHVDWARKFADPLLAASLSFPSPPAAGRKLRIGYVSPDFKRHSVTYFFEPILEHHDRSQFEITLYSSTERADEVTQRLRGKCDRWRDILPLSDHEAAQIIRADQIDVLIDLAGRTVGNRLLVFARKPAPVQITYLGYPETTGLRAIDYRFTDELADPPGTTEQFHTEKLWRMSVPFVRYRPPEESPPVADAPATRNGYVTFGSFNKAAKAGAETIALWSKVLHAMPTSQLVMKAMGLRTAGSRQRLVDGFAAQGIDSARLELIEGTQSLPDHLAMYGRIDVALDTFPYHGTTTTCEALWMGVPVVSLAGKKHVSRVGVSLLTAVGHADWAVESEDAFVTKAAELVSLGSESRHCLRAEMAASTLCDAASLTGSLEIAYRQMFTEFLKTGLFGR